MASRELVSAVVAVDHLTLAHGSRHPMPAAMSKRPVADPIYSCFKTWTDGSEMVDVREGCRTTALIISAQNGHVA
eukprot:2452445-Prymnesium_polylepis.1